MTIFESIKQQRMAARVDPERAVEATLLTYLVGELETLSYRDTVITDEVVIKMIKKLLRLNEEVLALAAETKKNTLAVEQRVLQGLLDEHEPQQMTEGEIRAALKDVICNNVGEAMKFMNSNFPGRYDRAIASRVAKELF